jgi:hypothetical protein
MSEMVLDLPFGNLDHRRQLACRHRSTDQQIEDSLTWGAIVGLHNEEFSLRG